jgi:Fe-S-cluster containining protein
MKNTRTKHTPEFEADIDRSAAPEGAYDRSEPLVHLPPLDEEPDPSGADCLACGRCCHHPPGGVRLGAIDEGRMSKRALALYTEVLARPPFSRFLQNDGERCMALDLSVPRRYACRIYEERPDGCRVVEPGSAECLEARRLGRLGFGLGDSPTTSTGRSSIAARRLP